MDPNGLRGLLGRAGNFKAASSRRSTTPAVGVRAARRKRPRSVSSRSQTKRGRGRSGLEALLNQFQARSTWWRTSQINFRCTVWRMLKTLAFVDLSQLKMNKMYIFWFIFEKENWIMKSSADVCVFFFVFVFFTQVKSGMCEHILRTVVFFWPNPEHQNNRSQALLWPSWTRCFHQWPWREKNHINIP